MAAAAVAAPVFSSSLPTVELDYSTVQAVGGNTVTGPASPHVRRSRWVGLDEATGAAAVRR
ncbi:hypothetical protein PF005_g3237 [Phytophthora fragariae]|uniref:Uncharacterized protein n=1 Tax=Phytophthora fragariae TaxID=53985 RepID=A0A6A3Z5W4_9STRA|nr:hypothetical protein PF005_g3237 [Phytophthora fragariae]